MKSPLIAALAASLLTACADLTTPCAVSLPPPPPTPSNLTAECPPLPILDAGSFPEVAGHLALTGHLYASCAARHNLLARLLKAREAEK